MKSPTHHFPSLLTLIAGSAVLLFRSAGIARSPGWNPLTSGRDGDMFSPDELTTITPDNPPENPLAKERRCRGAIHRALIYSCTRGRARWLCIAAAKKTSQVAG